MVRISEKEKRLLEILNKNSRIPYTKLGEVFGLTEGAVRKKVKKLLDKEVFSFSIELNYKKLGKVVAFVGFDVLPEKYSVIEKLKGFKEIKRLFSSSGDHMFLAFCVFENNDELFNFIKKLESIDGLVRICPAIIVEELWRSSSLF